MRLKYLLLSFFMLGLVHQFTFAQVSVTDKQGDKIVLMPDGTWKYADNNKQASVSNTVKAKQQTGQANIDKSKLSKAEKKLLKEQAEADKRRKKIAEKVAKQQKSKEPKTATKAKKPSKKDKKSKDTAKTKKPSKKDKKSKDTAKTKKPSKKDKKSKGTAKKNTKPSKKGNASKGTAKKNTKKTSQSKAKTVSNKQKIKLAKQGFKAFKASSIVIREYNCTYAVNEVDPFTGKRKVALENDLFFGYTHPQLEKYLKGENYLTCEGYLQQVTGLKIFNVKFTIDSPNATEDYGSILEGSRMLISLLDGTTVTLVSVEQDGGKIDRIDKETTYKTYFVIDGKAEKQLEKSEIDKVRVVWSEGFEDYEIHNVDFLMNQLECLNAAFK